MHYAIYIGSGSTGNTIHHNDFYQNNGAGKGVNGNCQAYDSGGGNHWYNNTTQKGNYWSNWDGNGWGTPNAYPIDGSAGASDWYPLLEPVGSSNVSSAPRNLTASAGNANVTLKWEPPADNGGASITNYTIYYGRSSGNYTKKITVGNITTYTVTGLTNGQKYYFAVSAINAVGESEKSIEVSAMPCTVPSAPKNLNAVAGNGNVTLTWAPPIDDGGTSITNYTIYYGTTSGNYTNNITVGNVTKYTIANLTNGQKYYFAVSAINAVGESEKSAEVSAMPCTMPSAPQNLTAVAGNDNVTLTWHPPASDGGSPVTGYKIYYGTSSGNYTTNITVGNVTNYTITNLTNGQKYYFAVSAINGAGEGARSNEVSATPVGEQQHGNTPGFDILAGICAIAVSMAVIAIWQRKKR
jgi:predicted phage tail protein